jgi:hypothetical protein
MLKIKSTISHYGRKHSNISQNHFKGTEQYKWKQRTMRLSILALLATAPAVSVDADPFEQQTISLAGPPPNGWQTTYKVDGE